MIQNRAELFTEGYAEHCAQRWLEVQRLRYVNAIMEARIAAWLRRGRDWVLVGSTRIYVKRYDHRGRLLAVPRAICPPHRDHSGQRVA